MSNIDTSVHASAESEEVTKLIATAVFYIQLIVLALTLATLIFGVTSWCMIRKFRNYRNYVCLSAILANFLTFSMMAISNHLKDIDRKSENMRLIIRIVSCFAIYFLKGMHHWLIIMCHMFYVDIVKVFNVQIRWRYLKSGLFGWGVPLITQIFFYVATVLLSSTKYYFFAAMIIFNLPVILNCILYIIIVCSLFRNSNGSEPTATNKWRRLYIATLIFILSDIFLLSNFIINLTTNSKIAKFHSFLLYQISALGLDIFLVVVKDNREIWYNHLSLSARPRDQDINMPERVIREAADSRPAVLDI